MKTFLFAFALTATLGAQVRELRSPSGAITLYPAGPLPAALALGVVTLRDCVTLDHIEDCKGSGDLASLIYAAAFGERKGTTITQMPRGLSAFDTLTDAAAADLGRAKGLAYVLTGEVLDYSSVAAFSGRKDRASLTVRLVRVADGKVVASQKETMIGGSNFSNPQRLVKSAAERFRKAVTTELK